VFHSPQDFLSLLCAFD